MKSAADPSFRQVRHRFFCCVFLCAFASQSLAAGEPDFPLGELLKHQCLECHRGTSAKGGLSLTSAEGIAKGSESGPVVTPGNPEASLLWQVVGSDKPTMPKGRPPLTRVQIEIIRKWIESGAKWPDGVTLQYDEESRRDWWSLKTLEHCEPPRIDDPWIGTPIDAFILDRLKSNGLSPSPEADRRTLIRRLSFDLLGLPPTPEETDRFLADKSPDAYERLVDQLLDSPRYGERFARYWLDVVHFGESHGYDKDKPRPNAWPYRDYVIRAFNSDKPYAQFVREQLAGDVLFPNDPDGIVATGMIAAGPWDFVGHVELREGTVDKDITRNLDRDDMVTTVMSTFQSLTVHCARCHDHKFDPISQREYYALQAVFAGVERADRSFDADPAIANRRRELSATSAELARQLEAVNQIINSSKSDRAKELESQIAAAQKSLAAMQVGKEAASGTNGYHSEIMQTADSTKWVQVDLGESLPIDTVILFPARPTDFPDTPGFGFPARYKVELSQTDAFDAPRVLIDNSKTDAENPGDKAVKIPADGQHGRYVRITATKLWPRTNDFVFALGELQVLSQGKNVAFRKPVRALDSIEAGRWSTAHLVDGFDSRQYLGTPEEIAQLVKDREQRESELAELGRQLESEIDRSLSPETRSQRKRLAVEQKSLDASLSELPPAEVVFAAANQFKAQGSFTPASSPRPIHILNRGDVRQPGEPVTAAPLSCMPVPTEKSQWSAVEEGARRIALANWMIDPQNGLTWRSIVNRVWQQHFGRGIVDTPNDFGHMGALPTHPELLDYLACEFRDQGGSLKWLHRQIVTSSVYRQGSQGDQQKSAVDAENRLLWRMNRRRLDAESIRDSVLYVSGDLDPTMGGPSVKQFNFKDDHSPVYDYVNFDPEDPANFRRGIYRFIVRSVPDPFMESFDCPDASLLTPRRSTTLTPLQALSLQNNPLMVRQAERLAKRLLALTNDPREQIKQLFLHVLSREPSDTELARVSRLVNQHGLANACRVLLNCNEFVFAD